MLRSTVTTTSSCCSDASCALTKDTALRLPPALPADRSGASEAAGGSGASALKATSRPERIAQLRERLEASSDNGARKGGDDEDGGFQDAQDALEEMQEEVGGLMRRRDALV